MRRRTVLIGAAICVVIVALFATACGGGSDTTTTAPTVTSATSADPTDATATTTADATATTASGTTSSIAVADADALAKYKGEMEKWVAKYDTKLNASVGALETITDPTNATAEQIQGAKDFADVMGKAAEDMQKIEAPEELAATHKAYADGLTTMATGFDQFVKALESKSTEDLAAAMASLSVASQIDAAETVLEQSLGIQLTSD
jgi:hypothetical protein